MKVYVRSRPIMSWLDPESAPILGAVLGHRLRARLTGERGVFLTLTYRREEWDDARDLYKSASEDQHVPLFLRRLVRACDLGSIKGKWFCKLEFQEGGWIHFHLVILGPTFLPHEAVTSAWGHGHVWIEAFKPRHVSYLSKYVSKEASVPAWLLLERPRSVKVIRVSPGFWGEEGRATDRARYERDPFFHLPVWVPIGQRLEEARAQTVILERGPERNRAELVALPVGVLLSALIACGCRLRRPDDDESIGRGWLVIEGAQGAPLDLEAVMGRLSDERGREARRQRRSRGGGPRVHLTHCSNPDALPLWLRGVVEEALCSVA